VAILQALISLISRSLGKILNAVFGWAVLALFGKTSPRQKTALSLLVALAAAWPLLLAGIVVPRIATAVLAFVPPSAQGPSWIMRTVWSVLALAVPMAVGLAVAAKAPAGSPRETFFKKVLRGFPITLGLAAAFLLVFLTVPLMRLWTLARRLKDEHVPLVTSADAYDDVAARMDDVFRKHGIDVVREDPPWWLDAPTTVLRKMGGKALRGFVPERLAYWNGPRLEVALHPSDLLLRGAGAITAFTHGLVVEELARSAALQTFDPAAQSIEQQIRRVWHVHDENPAAHRSSPALQRRLSDILTALATVDVSYDEWSILYRQCAQLSRALEGRPQLLAKEDDMANENETEKKVATEISPSSLPSTQLVAETAREAVALLKAQVELAKTELKEDLRSEAAAAKGLSVALLAAICVVNLLLVTGAVALAQVLPLWAALLIVAGTVLLIAGIAAALGWKRIHAPLQRTRKTLEEDVRWVKERIA
jgi:Putative Actinobacterial Holin-X, holin superfamily III